jgi:uncharacterized protein YndB with AHSA1/START domain
MSEDTTASPGTTETARVTTVIAVSPAAAFAIFTEETDRWWRREAMHRFGPRPGLLRFEGGAGGRLVEVFEDGPPFEVGKVLVWEPGARLVFEWRGRDFAPDERTEVELRFEPEPDGTRITLEHRGWDALRPGHGARHGLSGTAFEAMIGLFWGDLLTGLRAHARRVRAAQ